MENERGERGEGRIKRGERRGKNRNSGELEGRGKEGE